MAVVSTASGAVLVTQYQTGTTEAGAPIISQRSFSDVKSAATDQDVYDVAEALFGLIDYPLTSIRRDNRFDLTDEG